MSMSRKLLHQWRTALAQIGPLRSTAERETRGRMIVLSVATVHTVLFYRTSHSYTVGSITLVDSQQNEYFEILIKF